MGTSDFTDRIAPKEIIIPIVSGTVGNQPTMSGAMYISGAHLYVRTATRLIVLSGASIL